MLADGYEPSFDRDYDYGRQAELALDGLLNGLRDGQLNLENKHKSVRDVDLYVETEQNAWGRGTWTPSGIHRTRADVWAYTVADTDVTVLIPVARIRRAIDLGLGKPVECGGSNPTRGRLLNVGLLISQRCDP